jgi:hypothetical protein
MRDINPGADPLLLGGGRLDLGPAGQIRLTIPPTTRGYADAQMDDHRRMPRRRFPWRPPVRLTLRARASHPAPLGTLGFGFWNDPFSLSLGQGGAARRLPASPHALWFFYGSPPNDLAFAADIPGSGWKAMSLKSPSVPSPILAPAALGAWLLSRLPGVRRPVVQAMRRAVTASEAALATSLTEWHTYAIEWHPCEASFAVDNEILLAAPEPPPGPLGFIAWIDNQYAVASPEGGLRFGLIPTPETQWLEICDLRLEEL